MPGEVFFTSTCAIPTARVLDGMETEFAAALREVCDPLGLTFASKTIWDQPAVRFDADCVAAVRARGGTVRLFRRATSSPAPATTPPMCRASRRRR